jgi:hypothetical protein
MWTRNASVEQMDHLRQQLMNVTTLDELTTLRQQVESGIGSMPG